MKRYSISNEQGLYLGIFIIALLLRLVSLGSAVPGNDESALALQALDLVKGGRMIHIPQPGYILSAMFLFFLGGANDFTARFFPALLGACLIWIPYLFRYYLGREWACLAAFVLCLDPGLIAISRQANGIMFATAGVLFSLAFFSAHRFTLAGVAMGVALLGGPMFWQGMVSLIVSYFVYHFIHHQPVINKNQGENWVTLLQQNYRPVLLSAGLTFILAGSSFFTVPTGLSAGGAGLPLYFLGWFRSQEVPISRLINALSTTEFFLIVLALISVWKSISDWKPIDRFLGIWWVISTVLILLYPSRQVHDLTWSLLSMAFLAARQIPLLVQIHPTERTATLGQFGLSSILLIFIWLNLLGLTANPAFDFVNMTRLFLPDSTGAISANADDVLKMVALIGGVILLILTNLLVAWGWKPSIAWKGSILAFSLMFLILTLSSSARSAGFTKLRQAELWLGSPYFLEGRYLVQTIEDLSKWNRSEPHVLDLYVVDKDLPSLRWALRNMKDVRWTIDVAGNVNPSMVITSENTDINLAANYRGQDFVYSSTPTFAFLSPIDWPRWLAFREGLIEHTGLILWVRGDLFPGNNNLSVDDIP